MCQLGSKNKTDKAITKKQLHKDSAALPEWIKILQETCEMEELIFSQTTQLHTSGESWEKTLDIVSDWNEMQWFFSAGLVLLFSFILFFRKN